MPYAHVYEQSTFCRTIGYGQSVGYYSGDPSKLLDDI